MAGRNPGEGNAPHERDENRGYSPEQDRDYDEREAERDDLERRGVPPIVEQQSSRWPTILGAAIVFGAIIVLVNRWLDEHGGVTETTQPGRFAWTGEAPAFPVTAPPRRQEPKPEAPPAPDPQQVAQQQADKWKRVRGSIVAVGGSSNRQAPDPTAGAQSPNPYDSLENVLGKMGQEDHGLRPDHNQQWQEQVAGGSIATARARLVTGRQCKVLAGGMIHGTINHAIQSGLTGTITAITAEDVFADAGRMVMMPAGTEILIQVRAAVARGQTRIFAVAQRAKTPRGVIVDLASAATGPQGRVGIGGEVDTHFWERFGNAALVAVLGAGSAEIGGLYASAVARSFSDTTDDVLQDAIDIPPTIHARIGDMVSFVIQRDLDFSDVYRGCGS